MLTNGNPAPRRAYAALPLGWASLVLLLTLTPARNMPITPAWELLSFDTAAHAGVFAVLAGLSWFSLSRQRRWPRVARHAGLVVLAGSILFGGLIEVLQHTMQLGRHGDWTDLLSDGIGAALVVGLASWCARRQSRRARALAPAFWAGLLLAGLLAKSAQAQDLPRARRTIAKLASHEMHGRGYVKRGEYKAAAYLRGRLRELKLEPLAPDYTQPFTLDVNTFPGQLKLVADRELVAGRDFIAAPASAPCPKAYSQPVLLDTLLFTDTAAVRRLLHPTQLTGKVGVAVKPAKTPKGRQVASVVMRARDEARLAAMPPAVQQGLSHFQVRIILQPKLTASLAPAQGPYTRLDVLAASWPNALANKPVEVEVDAQLQRNYHTQNLAAVVRGTAQPDSFLVVTAHYDHLGTMGRNVYFPGANDNASGVALLLELAAHYAQPENRPAYSVVFLLFGAEEAGLVGSSYFVAHPLVPLTRIRFLVNLDLLGTGEQGATVVNGRVLEAPYQRLVRLNEASHYLPTLSARGRAANSDHYPFSEAGVPAFFFYTRGGSPAYHDVNDRPEALSLAGFAGAFGLVRDFLNELGAAK